MDELPSELVSGWSPFVACCSGHGLPSDSRWHVTMSDSARACVHVSHVTVDVSRTM